MTELEYMQGFDIETTTAMVLSVGETEETKFDIVLDKTCFYPRGGGQDWDTGTITSEHATFRVEQVHLDESGNVHHIGTVTEGHFSKDEIVQCKVDHSRRSMNSRLHSAGHVIDMAVASLDLDWISTKGQHYPHLSAVEYAGTWEADKAEELRNKLESRANEYVEAGSVNTVRFMPVEDMASICRHVPDNIPVNKPVRVVMYGKDFGVPCGGTHVHDIHQVGLVCIPKLKEKKGVIRVSYAIEGING